MTKVKNVEHIVHKKSSVSGKTPTAAQIEYGELAVNINSNEPFISFKDNADNIVKISPVAASDSPTAITVDNANQQILLDVRKPDDTTVQLSGDASNIIFESDLKNGLEVNNHEVNIKIDSASTSGLTVSQDGIKLSPDSAISSSSTNVVENKVLYEELDKKLDKINFINNIYPKGSVYITYEYKNPSTFIGGQWELIGGEDANKNYYPAFAIDTDTPGTTIDESLPNIKGSVALQSAFNNTFAAAGAFTQDTTLYEEVIDGAGARKRGTVWFNAHNSNSTYQDGAQVNVNAIKIFFWRRTDDATIVEQITPLDVDVKDVLFTGSAGGGTAEITLAHNFEDYKTLKITFLAATSWVMIRYIDTKDIKPRYLFDLNWANDAYRYCYFQGTQPASGNKLLIDSTSDVYVTEVVGIKPVPTSDVPTIDLKTFYTNVNMTTQGNFNGTITVPSGYVPLGEGSTIIRTNGAIGYGYVDSITKISDTQYKFTGWCNPNGISGSGADTITIYATFVKGPYTNLAKFVTAGDGINVSNTGEVSVAPLQKVTCTKTSLIGNEFYFGGEYYPALKTVHIHGGFAPTTSIGNGSGICRLTIGSQQVVFDDNVIGYVMCNNNATYMKFCQSAINTNQITARDLTIDTGRFYWLDLWCPAHLE